jgi:hypothetical protein
MKRVTTQVVTVGLVVVTALGLFVVASRARAVTLEIHRVLEIDSEIWVDATLQNCSASTVMCDTHGPSGPLGRPWPGMAALIVGHKRYDPLNANSKEHSERN